MHDKAHPDIQAIFIQWPDEIGYNSAGIQNNDLLIKHWSSGTNRELYGEQKLDKICFDDGVNGVITVTCTEGSKNNIPRCATSVRYMSHFLRKSAAWHLRNIC
jgi:hypothetical protein